MRDQVARTVIWSLLALVTGASCVANLGNLTGVANINDTSSVDGNDGVMVATIEANFRGNVAVMNTRDSRLSENFWVEPGRNFKIIKLPSGTYRWSGIHVSLGSRSGHCLSNDNGQFSIIGNAINYVGDPAIGLDDNGPFIDDRAVCHWSVYDNGSDTRRYLRVYYPNLSNALGFTWRLTTGTVSHRMPDSVLEDGEPRPVPSSHAVIAKVLTDTASFRDQLCACEDKTCADRVSRAMTRWTREFGLDKDSPKLTAEEQTQLDETTSALRECRSAAVARRRIPADPSPAAAPSTAP